MGGKFGTENIKKVLALAIEAGNISENFLKPDVSTIEKIGSLTKLLDEGKDMLSFSLQEMKQEVSELDELDKAELISFAKEKFDLENDAIELKIEAGFDLLIKVAAVAQEAVQFVKELKK